MRDRKINNIIFQERRQQRAYRDVKQHYDILRDNHKFSQRSNKQIAHTKSMQKFIYVAYIIAIKDVNTAEIKKTSVLRHTKTNYQIRYNPVGKQ